MKRFLTPILLLLLSLLALSSFFHSGFFDSHDGDWMVIRFSAFHQALTAGQFPTRFLDRLNSNYGYPVANFLYPLPFYLSEIPKLLKFNFAQSIKIIFVTGTIASVFTMFWCLRQRFSSIASFTGAVIYLYIPYRFVDLYVRGSLGESLAFVFPPICMGAIYKINQGDKKYLPILALSTALLILSHNVMALMFLPLILLFSLFMSKNKKAMLTFIAIGTLISAFFWLPALYDLQYVRLSQIKVSEVSNYLVSPYKIVIPSWGFDPNPNAKDGMSVQFGIVSICIFLAAAYLLIANKKRDLKLITLLIIYITIFFLMTIYLKPIWQTIPYLDVIQFPWRMLAIIVFISSYVGAYVVDFGKHKIFLASLLIIGSVISTFLYSFPKDFVNLPDGYYSTNEGTTTVRNEYMPLWIKTMPTKRADVKVQLSPESQFKKLQIRPANYSFSAKLGNETKVTVNTIYFPGWQVLSNGKNVKIDYKNQEGLITFKLPKGESDVIISYGKTPVHLISELISLMGLMITGFFFYNSWRKQNFS